MDRNEPSRFHLEGPIEFMTEDGQVTLGKGWLVISEAEYAALTTPSETALQARIAVLEGALKNLEGSAKALLDACYLADANEDLSGYVDGSLLDNLSTALEWRLPEIWTQEQVDALNASQEGYGHPFTCGGNRSDDAHREYAAENGGDLGQLIATKRGWVCPACDYRQFWAHDFQFEGAAPDPFTFFDQALNEGTTSGK